MSNNPAKEYLDKIIEATSELKRELDIERTRKTAACVKPKKESSIQDESK